MFLGKAAVFGIGNFLGAVAVEVEIQPTLGIRPITEELVEQILVAEMTAEDLQTLRFSAGEGEENQKAKRDELIIRLEQRLKTELGLPEDPIIRVIGEPDLVTIQTLRPKFDVQKHLLVLP